MINDKDNLKILRDKVQVFFERKIAVHINLKNKNKEWLNGEIKEVSEDFFILNEKKKGEMPVFFIEMYDINPWKEK